jgi:hypothetical protein
VLVLVAVISWPMAHIGDVAVVALPVNMVALAVVLGSLLVDVTASPRGAPRAR